MKEESNINTRKALSLIPRILNQKRVGEIEFSYRNTGKLDTETRKLIKEVV